MNKLRIQTLTLRQFKGVDNFTTNLNSESATIYGENGTGKSTLADAYLWLLTGKNNAGETFDPFPVNEGGQRKHDGQEPTVEAEFIGGDGETFTLKRSVVEKRTKKSGQSESIYTGDESKCWIDGVPKKITEYNAFVERKFAPESILRLLTCTGYFNQQVKKAEEKRSLLFQTFGGMDDSEILDNAPELAELKEALGRKCVADFHLQMKAEHSETCKQLDLLPVRIDEAAKSITDDIDVEAAKSIISKTGVELATLRYEVANKKDNPAEQLQYELQREKQAMQREESQWQDYIKAQTNEHEREHKARLREAETVLSECQYAAQDLESKIKRGDNRVAELEAEIHAKRSEWTAENDKQFNADTACPTCGQGFPASHVEEMRGNWNEQKSRKLSQISDKGKELAAERDKCARALDGLKAKLLQAQERFAEAEKVVREIKDSFVPFEPSPEAVDEHGASMNAIQERISELEQKLASITQDGDNSELEAKKQRIAELERQQAEQQELIARFNASEEARKRIEQYSAEQRKLGEVRDHTAKMLQLCEDFTRIKAERVTDSINRHFKIVRFVLFEILKNGGLKPDCLATVDGVEFSQLNKARQVAAALDIIDGFSKKLNLNFPVFLDNAESVIESYGVEPEAQVVRLAVSKGDKKLRIELEGG